MQIRDNVRQRRRERIQQLIGQHSNVEQPEIDQTGRDLEPPALLKMDETIGKKADAPAPLQPETQWMPTAPLTSEPDPELWWKEKQRQLKYESRGWEGVKGLSPTSNAPVPPASGKLNFVKLIRGFTMQAVLSGILFAAIWGWFKLELPGSPEAREWLISAVSTDMDFQAIEAWYGETFGGSPSFFPIGRNSVITEEVSAVLKPEDTVAPVKGRVVRSFSQSENGVQIAALAGSEVVAVYTGRVQQVTKGSDGVTILVQHPNRVLTVYGNLENSAVKPNDWVETGQKLGQLNASGDNGNERLLYFAVQQNGKTMDPAEVIPFD